MKAHLYSLVLICFLFFNCSKTEFIYNQNTDLYDYGLNGNVKSVSSKVYRPIIEKDTFKIGERINGNNILNQNKLLEFNKLGYLTSLLELNYNGNLKSGTLYTYDKENRVIEINEIDYNGVRHSFTYEFKYDKQDSLVEYTMYDDNNFKRIHKGVRDTKNRLVKSHIIQNDTIMLNYIIDYDENNNIIVENRYKNDTIPIKFISRTFNSQNLKQREDVTSYGVWDTLFYCNRFFYNKNKKLILEKSQIVSDSSYYETKYSYHTNGKLKKSVHTPIGNSFRLITVRTEKFNKNGNLIELSRTPNDNSPTETWHYKYKYDAHKNWIEKIDFKDDKPLEIVKRTIKYY